MSTRYSRFNQTQYYMQVGIKTMIFLENLDFNLNAMKIRIICIDNKAICIWLFVFICCRYWLIQKHTTSSVFDKAILKGLSEQISTNCDLKQAEAQIITRIPRVL